MDQKLLIRTESLNQPNQQLELYALYVQKLTVQDHSIRRYERDTKANPCKHPFIGKSRHYVTFSHWIGRDHVIELDPDHLESEHLFTWTLLMMEQV